MDTQNYKRTIAGSVGAGVGALFNASGRTYFMLEHKTNTKYHNAGDTQKIIIDEIELGRDGSCQVRFDESCETVSRKHAAIQRSGENWKLIHLSTSNPTLVNGTPIQGEYILQNGDEIQLSVGGPRMGFIIPQGKQALTSSIGLTERMSLFRQQALAPYKRALWTMAFLLLVVIVGFGAWNYQLHMKNKALENEITSSQAIISDLNDDIAKTQEQIEALKNKPGRPIYVKNDKALKELEDKLEQLEAQKRIEQARLDSLENVKTVEPEPVPPTPDPTPDALPDIAQYTPYVYSLKIDNIKISLNGTEILHDIANPDIVGNGFLIENGNFVTARQNVEPWIYYEELGEPWRNEMAQYRALGCEIEITYSAYSSTGTAKKLTFSSRDFNHPGGDLTPGRVVISKPKRNAMRKSFNLKPTYGNDYSLPLDRYAKNSQCFAMIRGLANTGIPTSSSTIEGGQSLKIAGYEWQTDVHNLTSFRYLTSTTVYKDEYNGTFILQDGDNKPGYLGSPAFIQGEDKGYTCVGIYVGKLGGNPRIVPINRCY